MATAHQLSPPVRVVTARAVGLVLAVVALWDGAGLVYGGDNAVQSPSWAVLRTFPGPEAVGLIFLATAVVLIWALARPGELLAWVLSGGMCLYAMVAVSFWASWWVTSGQVVWTAPSKNLALAAFWGLVLFAKPIPLATEAPRRGRE